MQFCNMKSIYQIKETLINGALLNLYHVYPNTKYKICKVQYPSFDSLGGDTLNTNINLTI